MVFISKCAKEWLRLKYREFIITVLLICAFGFFVTFHVRRFVSGGEETGQPGEYTAQEYTAEEFEVQKEGAEAEADPAENSLPPAGRAADEADGPDTSSTASYSDGIGPAKAQNSAPEPEAAGTKGKEQTGDKTGKDTQAAKNSEISGTSGEQAQAGGETGKNTSEKGNSKSALNNGAAPYKEESGKAPESGLSAGTLQTENPLAGKVQENEKKDSSAQTELTGKNQKTEASSKGQTGQTEAGPGSTPFSLQADNSQSRGKESSAGGAASDKADARLRSVPKAAALSGREGTEAAAQPGGQTEAAGSASRNADGTASDTKAASEGTKEEMTEQDYRQELADIEVLVEQLKNSRADTSTWSYLNIADYELKLWDDELNVIYKDIMSRLDTEEAEKLKKEERTWIRQKDEDARKAASRYKGGTLEGLEHTASLAKSTRERAYALLDSYGSCLPQEETQ